MIIIVGSGPAGVSAAKALTAKGLEVTMLDVGYTLEPEREGMVHSLRESPFESWDKGILNTISDSISPDVKGLPKKLLFGSDFPFRQPQSLLDVRSQGVDVLFSHAKGGLSNVWGANMLPLLPSDTQEWPFPIQSLDKYYRKVLSFVDLSARNDSLEELYPLHSDTTVPLSLSSQANHLLSGLAPHAETLRAKGVFFGAARIAVRASAQGGDSGCIYCGHCLYGCPYNLIYSSNLTLQELLKDPHFRYVPEQFVEKIEERGEKVTVIVRNSVTNRQSRIEGDRVLLAAGTVSSTRIALESLDAYDREILIKDSQYFMVPFLRYRSSGDVTSERLHTLAQVALNIVNKEVSTRTVHALFYTYNDLYLRAMQRLCGPLFPIVRPFAKMLLSRLMVIQGYLHSDESPAVGLRVSRPDSAGKRSLVLEASHNAETKPIVRRFIKQIFSLRHELGGVPLTPLLHIGIPGKSYHIGASFPMRVKPSEFESDSLGRPHGLSRTHLIDTAAFTNVPATNVTLTIMANAFRIADEISQ